MTDSDVKKKVHSLSLKVLHIRAQQKTIWHFLGIKISYTSGLEQQLMSITRCLYLIIQNAGVSEKSKFSP